jgi:hypothetical protein
VWLLTPPPELEPETEPVTVAFAILPPLLEPETDTVPAGVLDANTVVNAVVPPELAVPLTTLNALLL